MAVSETKYYIYSITLDNLKIHNSLLVLQYNFINTATYQSQSLNTDPFNLFTNSVNIDIFFSSHSRLVFIIQANLTSSWDYFIKSLDAPYVSAQQQGSFQNTSKSICIYVLTCFFCISWL